MNLRNKKILLIILSILLVLELAFMGISALRGGDTEETLPVLADVTEEPSVPTESAEAPTGTEVPETEAPPTEEPTEEPTQAPAEPTEQRYILTFTGDCTLGSTADKWSNASHFIKTVGENYAWPFANVLEYFENDDFTMINLEGVLADGGTAASKRFAFRGPTAYTQILTGSSVEAVTLANNHTEDYGTAGYQSTTKALDDADIAFVEKNQTALYTTESGLKIGMYAGSFDFSASDIKNDIAALKKQGAEIIICAFHWGSEGKYRPNSNQEYYAKLAIDAGADIVYGNHPHVLQKIETYGNGIIYYSLGNFSFGGSVFPQDYDTALLQQEVIRDVDGTVRLGELTIIPCSISSMSGQNNFQPTPLEAGKAYDRVLSKLDGSFTGPDLVVEYDPVTTEPSATEPETPAATEVPQTPAETAPSQSGGSENTGGSDAPAGDSSGSDSSSGGSDAPASGSDNSSGGSDAPASGSDSSAGGGSDTPAAE